MYRYFRTRMPGVARPLLAAAIGMRAATKLVLAAVDARRLYERGH
jgi:hypothetical protein